GIAPSGMRPSVDMARLANDMGNATGVAFFGSSNKGQLSWEDPKLEAGVFTYALIEGLRGKAAVFGERSIETTAMWLWLKRQIPKLAKERCSDCQQNPVRTGSGEYTIAHKPK